jgi:acyl CoA:acetate/3-ketoacid CoA transferase alpha subunit
MLIGFGLCGIPENLIRSLNESGLSDLTVVSNNAGYVIAIKSLSQCVKTSKSMHVSENSFTKSC